MALETATKVSELVATNPVGATDKLSAVDDHIRLIKSTLLTAQKTGMLEVVEQTGTSFTAVSGKVNLCTNVAAVTATLPASPADGDVCGFRFFNGLATNAINRNGKTIGDTAENMTVNVAAPALTLFLRFYADEDDWGIE